MQSSGQDEVEVRKRPLSWTVFAGAALTVAVVLILLFRPLAISFHRWQIQVLNERDEGGEDISHGTLFMHCEELDRLGYAFHKDFVFDRVPDTPEALDVLFKRLNGFVKTLPQEPILLKCHSGPPGYDIMEFRVCDRAARKALWTKFHKRHNVPDLAEQFGAAEEP